MAVFCFPQIIGRSNVVFTVFTRPVEHFFFSCIPYKKHPGNLFPAQGTI